MIKTDEVKNLSVEIGTKRIRVDETQVHIEDTEMYDNRSQLSFPIEQFKKIVSMISPALER